MDSDDLKNYKAKAEYYVRQHQDNAVNAKLKSNVPLTSADVKVLEEILWSEVGTQQEYEAEYGAKPLGEFVREIVGLNMNAAKAAFAEFLNDANLDSRQIYFVNQIVEYIVHNAALHTPEALPGILEWMIREGYTVVPISELILQGEYTIDHTGRQFPAGE